MKTRCIDIIVLFFLIFGGLVHADEKKITIGKEEQWRSLIASDGVMITTGKWGNKDLVLQDSEYKPDTATELLVHFNQSPPYDSAGVYSVKKSQVSVNTEYALFGPGCGVMQNGRGIEFSPSIRSMFVSDSYWQDFTIEFWLYPAALTEGESVLFWEGVSVKNSEFYQQKIEVLVSDRKLVWQFKNFFRPPDGDNSFFELSSVEKMVPRIWHHHMIRYNSSLGLLQYCIDGVPVGVLYTTKTRHEENELWTPLIEKNDRSTLLVGKNFTGFMDELRIQKQYVEKPVLEKYQYRAGKAVTRVFDLGYSGTRIKSVAAEGLTPSDSQMNYYIRVSDYFNTIEKLKESWIPFVPGSLIAKNLSGRYVQILIEFFPNGTNSVTPRLYNLEITYEPDYPPVSPADLRVIPGNGKVTISWKAVTEDDVVGYMVFYGPRPLQYTGEDAFQGSSPIDVGKTTSVVITGLQNGKLYYFTVVAYDSSTPPHLSEFSLEKSVRPSEVLP